jgi:two-component system cell cycle sensor histidine kinase/response regulator CckA
VARKETEGEIVTGKELHSGEDSKEQKQTGKMARERQTRFQRISAITSDIAYSCHTKKDGGFSLDWITGAAERITGYSAQEIKAHGCWRFLVVEEDIPLFEKSVIGLAPGSRGSCELRIRHKNGNIVWISSFAECVAAAKIPGRLLYGGLTEITERKQVEEELRASEARYRRLFEAAKDGILILDADTGMIMDVNAFLTEMLGFSREEFLGQHIWDLGFFKGIVANEADFLKLQQKEYIRYEDVSLETADGRRINVEFVSNLYPVGQAKVIQCSMRRAHLASFPAQDPSPVVEVGTDGAVHYANPAAMATLARLGLNPDARQFLPGTPEELVLLRSQCEQNPQTQELHLGGETFLRTVTAPPGGDSLRVYLIDITDRKQAEEELRESKKLLSQTEETARIGGWVFDAEKKTEEWTEETFRILEIDVTEGEPKAPEALDFIVPAFRPMAEQGRQRALEFGEPYDQEWEIITARGNRRWVHAVAKAYQEQGKTKRVSGSFQDITERKQAEAQLRQSQKMEAIGELAGGVAHDFNNLLTGILGNIALMRSTLAPADPLLENLDAAETAARQATTLTKGLLTFSRSAVVLPVPMSITAALDATLALLKQSLPATMEIVRDYEQTAWNVLVDQSQITQILLNLTVNARDAMKGNGTLTIRTRNLTIDTAYVLEHPYARTGEFVHLSVTDTGPGMSSEVMQHLFEPFYTTKPIGSGTGLGLSIVYGAVKQAGGWITAVSTEGVGRTTPQKHPSEAPLGLEEHPRGDWENILGSIGQTCSGATFDIYLPRCLEERTPSFAPRPILAVAGSGTVLVVEDEPIVCAVAQALLSRSGYTVLTAPDGASALNILQDRPVGIGLILLDMTMPGMTTGEVVQAIRVLDPRIPILLNSGHGAPNGTVNQMLKEGTVQGFLGKPYTLGELVGKVQELLHRG